MISLRKLFFLLAVTALGPTALACKGGRNDEKKPDPAQAAAVGGPVEEALHDLKSSGAREGELASMAVTLRMETAQKLADGGIQLTLDVVNEGAAAEEAPARCILDGEIVGDPSGQILLRHGGVGAQLVSAGYPASGWQPLLQGGARLLESQPDLFGVVEPQGTQSDHTIGHVKHGRRDSTRIDHILSPLGCADNQRAVRL